MYVFMPFLVTSRTRIFDGHRCTQAPVYQYTSACACDHQPTSVSLSLLFCLIIYTNVNAHACIHPQKKKTGRHRGLQSISKNTHTHTHTRASTCPAPSSTSAGSASPCCAASLFVSFAGQSRNLSMKLCVCIHTYICIHVYVCIDVYVIYTCIHVCVYICIHLHVYIAKKKHRPDMCG
jgi:hypothetical protein